jgi:hypothetical protein
MLVRQYLNQTAKYEKFYHLYEKRYISVFGNKSLPGEQIPFALPSSSLPIIGQLKQCNSLVNTANRQSVICINVGLCCKQITNHRVYVTHNNVTFS